MNQTSLQEVHDTCALFHNIRAVVFDAVGTLIYPVEPIAESYRRTIKELTGRELDPQFIHHTVSTALRHRSRCRDAAELISSEEDERDFWFRLIGQLCAQAGSVSECFDALFAYFARPSAWRCFSDTATVLGACRKANKAIAIGSNFDRRLHTVCDGLPEFRCVARRFISSEIGWRKPSIRFYQTVAAELQCAPEEILMVGDDFENDVAGAHRAGFHALWLNREKTSPSSGIPASAPAFPRTQPTTKADAQLPQCSPGLQTAPPPPCSLRLPLQVLETSSLAQLAAALSRPEL